MEWHKRVYLIGNGGKKFQISLLSKLVHKKLIRNWSMTLPIRMVYLALVWNNKPVLLNIYPHLKLLTNLMPLVLIVLLYMKFVLL